MSYLMIRNHGVAPIESFTILGLSTARGSADAIGQFGSGSKHGVLTLMRLGVPARIFLGQEELSFHTKPNCMGDRAYDEVRYRFHDEDHKTGTCLDFGALDWDNVDMALREFICNALDQGESLAACVCVVDDVQPHSYETRVFVELTPEVRAYYANLSLNFLHLTGAQNLHVLPARRDTPRLYRRGVFVRTVVTQAPALFDYNFTDEKIDESRNMNDGAFSAIAARLLIRAPERLQQLFASFGEEPRWEHGTLGNVFQTWESTTCDALCTAWRTSHADKCFTSDAATSQKLTRKGIPHVVIPQTWEYCLGCAGLVNGKRLLTTIETFGGEELPATATALATFRRAWSWLESVRLTDGKPFPPVACFTQPMDGGQEKTGLYRNGTVYLNVDYDTNEQTALEELAHYITEAADETRDFQDFAFKVATRMAKNGQR